MSYPYAGESPARSRIANGAWVTRESVGRGLVILFAHAPAFRAAQLGAMRVLENALILGPGLGTNQPVNLPRPLSPPGPCARAVLERIMLTFLSLSTPL
jgi:hypothetical protein